MRNKLFRYVDEEAKKSSPSGVNDLMDALRQGSEAARRGEYEFASAQFRVSLRLMDEMSVPGFKAWMAAMGAIEAIPLPHIQKQFLVRFDKHLPELQRSKALQIVGNAILTSQVYARRTSKNKAPLHKSFYTLQKTLLGKARDLMPAPVKFLLRLIESHAHPQV